MSDIERWEILPHVHRECFGRLLARTESCGTTIVRCSCCGAEAEGSYTAMCPCGINTGLKRVRLRCIANPAPSPECSDEIVVEEIPAP
jgi:hypothetical protein